VVVRLTVLLVQHQALAVLAVAVMVVRQLAARAAMWVLQEQQILAVVLAVTLMTPTPLPMVVLEALAW
jgi:hypothetical protein